MELPRYTRYEFDLLPRREFANNQQNLEWRRGEPNSPSGFAPLSFNSAPRLVNSCSSQSPVLLIEHDPEIRGLVKFGLEQQGFEILEAGTAKEGIELAVLHRPGVVLLAMDIPDGGGLAVIMRLREWSQIPILALSGRTDDPGPISALDHGATDYIVRPFKMAELSARLRAAQRRLPSPDLEMFHSGSLIVDLTSRTVKVANRQVNLSATEYSILQLFVRHAGKVLTHAQILREVWGAEMLDKVQYLRVYLLALRKKLETPSEPDLFLTERAVGYRLVIREA